MQQRSGRRQDGLTDWPEDTGCIDVGDTNERSTYYYSPCDDVKDGDGDGYAAFPEDSGCASAQDPYEAVDFPAGMTLDAASSVAGDCALIRPALRRARWSRASPSNSTW